MPSTGTNAMPNNPSVTTAASTNAPTVSIKQLNMDPNDRRSNVSASSTSFEARLSVLNNRTHAQQNKTEQNRTN